MSAAAGALGLTPELLERLRALGLQGRRLQAGAGAGRRRSPRAGASVELMDYRNYVPGDDFRRLDWKVYARLERLFLRIYRAEENLRVRLLVDTSRSMDHGGKFRTALALAGALAYVALVRYDRAEVLTCGGDQAQAVPPGTGEGAAERIWRFLGRLEPKARGDLNRGIAEAGLRSREPGLSVVLTDGLYPGGCIPGLSRLLAAGHDVVLAHLLAPDEVDPDLEGDWRLVDVEDASGPVEMTAAPATVGRYRRRVLDYMAELAGYCRRHGAVYLHVPGGTDLSAAAMSLCRRAGVVG